MQQEINIYNNNEPYSFLETPSVCEHWIFNKLAFTLDANLYCFSLKGSNEYGYSVPYKSFCLDTPAPALPKSKFPKPREITINGLQALKKTLNFLNFDIFSTIEQDVLNKKEFAISYPKNKQNIFFLIKQNNQIIALINDSGQVLSIRHHLNNQDLILSDYQMLALSLEKTISSISPSMARDNPQLQKLNNSNIFAHKFLTDQIKIFQERQHISDALPLIVNSPIFSNKKI